MTLARHVTSQRYQRCCAKAKLFRAEHRADDDIAPRLKAPIDTNFDALTQSVAHQHLLRLRQATFPGHTSMLDRLQGRGTGTAIVSTDKHIIGMRFRYSGGDGAYADAGYQLDAHFCAWIDLVQIVD